MSIIIVITYVIGLGAFNHIIAGSTTMFYLMVTGSISFGAYLAQFLLPVLVGNVVGGFTPVAALGHVQVVGNKEG